MELLQLVLLLLSLIPAAYVCFHKLTSKKNSKTKLQSGVGKPNLPPGSTGWALIRENFDIFFGVREGFTYKYLTEKWNKYSSNVFRISPLGETIMIFSSPEGNKFLFSNEKKLVQVWLPIAFERMFPTVGNLSSGEQGHSLRAIIRAVLKMDGPGEYVGIVDEAMKKHLERDWNSKQVTVLNAAKRYVFGLECNMFLGIDDASKIEELRKRMDDMVNGIVSLPINLPGTALNRAIKGAKFVLKEIEAKVRQRKINQSSAKDLISHMLLETDENGEKVFCEADIASHLGGLLVGGYSTLHGTLANVINYLAELPDVYDSVLKEQKEILEAKQPNEKLTLEDIWKMKYSWCVVCEVLRMGTLGGAPAREVISDFTYEGYTIPKRSKILFPFSATHNNPKYFPNPEKFDPSRFYGNGPIPYTFVPFGGGPRMCPGHNYARIVILVFVHNVVTKFRLEKQIPEENIAGFPFPKPTHGLPVVLHPHKP